MSTFFRIQKGSDTVAASSNLKAVTFPQSVDMSKTIFFAVMKTQSNTVYANNMCSYQLISTTQGQVQRGVSGPNIIDFDWYTLEFSSGVSVRRGSSFLNSSPVNGTLSPTIDSTKSIPFVSCRTSQTFAIFLEDIIARAYFPNYPSTAESQIRFDFLTTDGLCTYEWQVLELDDADVDQQLGQSTGTSSNQTVDAPDLSKVFLICTTKATVTTDPNGMKVPRFDAVNNVRLASWNTKVIDYVVHAVKLPNILVQRDYFGWSGISSSFNLSTPVVEADTFLRSPMQQGHWGSANTSSQDANNFNFIPSLDDDTTVSLDRYQTSGVTVATPVEVIQFGSGAGGAYPWLDRVGQKVGEKLGTEYS